MTAGVSEAPREVRRAAYKQERAERRSGRWSPWRRASEEMVARAYELSKDCWLREVHTVWTNGWMNVSVRTIHHNAMGFAVDHAFLRTALQDELTWKEKQRIKDELFGENRMAVEVFPRKTDLIDAADLYHLWVFPEGYRFDFGLGKGQL